MSLVVHVGITARDGHLETIGGLVIQRMEPLDNPRDPADEVHTYEASIDGGERVPFTHRYGDGAWQCISLALSALAGKGQGGESRGE